MQEIRRLGCVNRIGAPGHMSSKIKPSPHRNVLVLPVHGVRMVISALPDTGRGAVGGCRKVADVVGLGPSDVPVANTAMGVVGDSPAADGLAAAVLAAGAVDAVHAHEVVLGITAPVVSRNLRSNIQHSIMHFTPRKLFTYTCLS